MSEKPSYLGLLNAIANGEGEAERYLLAWAKVTDNDEVRHTITAVALREGEHSKAFAKRIWELGYEVQPRDDAKAKSRYRIAASKTMTDAEKFEKLSLGRDYGPDDTDIFSGFFRDLTIDIQTGQLLGRYIAEERDSNRMLAACRKSLT